MNFPQQHPLPFTRAAIENLSPNQKGCYGIFAGTTCLYIGRGDIRARLLCHVGGEETPGLLQCRPTTVFTVVTPDEMNREKALMLLHRPTLNQRFG